MNRNNMAEIPDSTRRASAQNPSRPSLRPACPQTDRSKSRRNLPRLNRKEEHCCSRATD
jgi:hypothetical protein